MTPDAHPAADGGQGADGREGLEMVKVLIEGHIPDPPRQAWPFNADDVLVCPRCNTRFAIEEPDMPPWSVRRERCIGGREEASGPCPFCREQVRIARRIP